MLERQQLLFELRDLVSLRLGVVACRQERNICHCLSVTVFLSLFLSLPLPLSLSLSFSLSLSLSRARARARSLVLSLSLCAPLSLPLFTHMHTQFRASLQQRLMTEGHMQWFPGGRVFKAHGLVYYSTLGLRVIKKKKRGMEGHARERYFHAPDASGNQTHPLTPDGSGSIFLHRMDSIFIHRMVLGIKRQMCGSICEAVGLSGVVCFVFTLVTGPNHCTFL